MLKAAIITLQYNFNYGNRLQNYAVQNLLEQCKVEAVTLFNKDYTEYCYPYFQREDWFRWIKYVIRKILFFRKISPAVSGKFDRFNREYIRWGELFDTDTELSFLNEKYDFFVAGSDQIWNPEWNLSMEKEYLMFADYDKTIAFSGSFGVSVLPEGKKQKIKAGLEHIKYLSVRENQGADIIRELTGRDVPVLIDPTMGIDIECWKQLENPVKGITDERYVLCYVLGNMTEDMKSLAERYALEQGLKIYYLEDFFVNWQVVGPQEFLYLIHHAELVITDSFHGCVFSLLYHVNLKVFKRVTAAKEDMNSRIYTLFEKFSLPLEYLWFQEETLNFSLGEKEWSRFEEILEQERNRQKNFLLSALSQQ